MTDRWPHSLMWYDTPGKEWKEGLPIGNGRLAGMMLGGVEQDRIALNHELLWRGEYRDRDVAEAHQCLAEIRRLFFEGKTIEAANLANLKLGGLGGMSGVANRVNAYQPAGDLFIETLPPGVTDYRRQLDLDSAVVTTTYQSHGATFTRDCLAHFQLPAILVRLHSSEPLTAKLTLSRIKDKECRVVPTSRPGLIGFDGRLREGVGFSVLAKVISDGSVAAADGPDSSVHVTGRDIIIVLSIAVDYAGADCSDACVQQIEQAAKQTWAPLLDSHVKAHRALYRRVLIDVGEDLPHTTTEARVQKVREHGADPGLQTLYTNFGRYLVLASSRPGGTMMNLQGKWNEELSPPWESDLHNDINVQMHHWPIEPAGLPECMDPFFRYLDSCVPHGREAARKLYNCRGVYIPIQTDPWGRMTPEAQGWDVWTGAAAWLAQHLWTRYEYGRDLKFLRERAYPFLKEVCAFYEDYLVPDPVLGQLVTVPSQSPENHFVGGIQPVSLCVGATMDFVLIREALGRAVAASEILGVDPELNAKWKAILDRIPPYKVGKHGQLQEWLEDYDESEPGHRHLSHLYGLFPGDEITIENEPELARAARISLERRLESKGGHTGWSRAWVVCCWARLREGDLAFEHLNHLITDFATTTLLDLHPPRIFQIDGNLGGAAGFLEMLVQSHRGTIRLLPALPTAWPNGRVQGVRARDGFTVDIRWSGGAPTAAIIHSALGGPCRLSHPAIRKARIETSGHAVPTQPIREQVVEFPTAPGWEYRVSW